MKKQKKIACFFTCGFTELNAMKTFIERINNNVDYIQLCPNGPRKNKNQIRNRISISNAQNGLTGESLIEYVVNSVKKPFFTKEKYDAILIEDDKDNRFFQENSSTVDINAWVSFKNNVCQRLDSQGVKTPVIFLLAAPEIEAWFISDWNNGFGKVYENELNGNQNSYFSTVFRKYVKEKVLTEKYDKSIESYGQFNDGYKKLSEEIQSALSDNDFFSDYTPAFEHKPISYSKRVHGQIMLANINPSTIQSKCKIFFKEAFLKLKQL